MLFYETYVGRKILIRKCHACGCQIKPKVTRDNNFPVVTCPVCGVELSSGKGKQLLKLLAVGVGIWFMLFVYHLMSSQVKLFLG